MRRALLCIVVYGSTLTASTLLPSTALAGCGATTFQPVSPFVPSGTIHSAYYLTDPAGEQRAIFDLVWGGQLASLKQNGVERIWGNATGGMAQPALHSYPSGNGQEYNPTAAGDNRNQGSPVISVTCPDANTLFIVSGMLDYNLGASGYRIGNAFANGSVLNNSFGTPYVVTTKATFVTTPGNNPAYYLKLTQTITNTHPSETFPWSFEIAGYVPFAYTNYARYPSNCTDVSPCPTASTPALLAGLYPNNSLTGGTAFLISPQTYWDGSISSVSFAADSINQNQSTHLFNSFWGLGPGRSKSFIWFVLVGDWAQALSFARSPSASGLSFYTTTPCRVFDSRNGFGSLANGRQRSISVSGTCGIPVTARALSLNMTAVNATGQGFLTIYPLFGQIPGTQSLSFDTSLARSCQALLGISPDGSMEVRPSIGNGGSVDVIVDVTGWFQ